MNERQAKVLLPSIFIAHEPQIPEHINTLDDLILESSAVQTFSAGSPKRQSWVLFRFNLNQGIQDHRTASAITQQDTDPLDNGTCRCYVRRSILRKVNGISLQERLLAIVRIPSIYFKVPSMARYVSITKRAQCTY